MYRVHFFDEVPLSGNHSLHTPSEPAAGGPHHGVLHLHGLLLDLGHQGSFRRVCGSVGLRLQDAPEKIVHRIYIWRIGRLDLLGDHVEFVLLEPGHGLLRHMTRPKILLPDNGQSPAMLLINGITTVSITDKYMDALTFRQVSKMWRA